MSADPVAQLLSDPRFSGQPITWGITSEGYDAVRRAWLTHVHAEEVLFKPFTEDQFKAQMQIMLSVFEFSELWVIDHSTKTAEAAIHEGGRSGKGGDLLYRWGNPRAYRAGTVKDQKLFGQHNR